MIRVTIRQSDGQRRIILTTTGVSIPTGVGEVIEEVRPINPDSSDSEVVVEDVIQTDGNRGFRLGDAVARVTKFVGIKPCAPCTKRQARLNKFSDKLLGKDKK